MKLNALMDNKGARAGIKRVGRGLACGYGKTCGRGTKGQKARAGSRKQATFQGGQMPILRRFPNLVLPILLRNIMSQSIWAILKNSLHRVKLMQNPQLQWNLCWRRKLSTVNYLG